MTETGKRRPKPERTPTEEAKAVPLPINITLTTRRIAITGGYVEYDAKGIARFIKQ